VKQPPRKTAQIVAIYRDLQTLTHEPMLQLAKAVQCACRIELFFCQHSGGKFIYLWLYETD
jgi:hypothetical protein